MKTNIFKTVRRSAAVLLGALMVTPSWSQVNKELTMTANVETTINLKRITETGAADNPLPFIDFEYKKNDASWAVVDTTAGVSLAPGDVVSFRAKEKVYQLCSTTGVDWSYYNFSSSSEDNTQAHVMLSGNIMSMLAPVGFADSTSLKVAGKECGSTFIGLFQGLPADIEGTASDPKLVLPATTLTDSCYTALFKGNKFLTVLPKLPATTLAKRCYDRMFRDCGGLKYAPELPATAMAEECYTYMFQSCDNLTKAPALSATTLAKGCYNSMFYDCKSISETPDLPATTLAENCYASMFRYCTGLTKTHNLPAKVMEKQCYYYMFANCSALTECVDLSKVTTLAESCFYCMFYATSVTKPTALPVTTLAKKCYAGLFQSTKLETAPELPATELADSCYYGIFRSTLISEAPALPATVLKNGCYLRIFKDCANITKALPISATELLPYCFQEMYAGTAITEAPSLPATSLVEGCYEGMFQNCKSLKSAPKLPATNLAPRCYYAMFSGCSSLTTPPALPATTLAEDCYNQMFLKCTGLTTTPVLGATAAAKNCYRSMFAYCSALTSAPDLPATTLAEGCYAYMMHDCTKLKVVKKLPATELAYDCYDALYWNCTDLKEVPEDMLPAPTLKNKCYRVMFNGCKSLTNVPTLPATVAVDSCYQNMFSGCTELETLPVNYLESVTSFGSSACQGMFANCSKLKNTSKFTVAVSITVDNSNESELAKITNICDQMFSGCSSLTTIDGINLAFIGPMGINKMFFGCTSLEDASTLKFTLSENKPGWGYGKQAMTSLFEGCTSLKKIPTFVNGISDYSFANGVFRNCSSLSGHIYLKLKGTQYDNDYANWFEGTKITSVTLEPLGYRRTNSFTRMFDGCETLETLILINAAAANTSEFKLNNNYGVIISNLEPKNIPSTWTWIEKSITSGFTKPVISENTGSEAPFEYWKEVYVNDPEYIKDVLFVANRPVSLTEEKAATVCFPVPVTVSSIIGGGSFYTFTGVQKNEETNKWEAVYSEYTEDKLVSNMPYIYVPSSDEKLQVNEELTLDDTSFEPKAATVGDWTFQGVYKKTNWNAESDNITGKITGKEYGFAAENRGTAEIGDFVQIGEGAWQNAGTAYLKYTGSDDPFKASTRGKENLPERITVVLKSINGDGQTTAIGSIDTKTGEISFDDKGDWYTISGNRLSEKPSKTGVYIHNGKKVIIK